MGPRLWSIDSRDVPLHMLKRYRSSNREPDGQQPNADRDQRAAGSGSCDRYANATADAHTHADASANQGTDTTASTAESLSECARRKPLVLQFRAGEPDLFAAEQFL